MCFSPTADLVGGIFITAVGVDVLRNLRGRHDHIVLAALPLLLGLHQLTETFVWWGLRGNVPRQVGTTAMWIYLLFAFVVLPTYIPFAIRALEPSGTRRRIMDGFLAVGLVVSALLLAAMIRGPVSATESDHHISYTINLAAGLVVVGGYVLVTCGSALFSGLRHIAIFGAVNLIVVAILAKTTIEGFASLWCAWAAIASIAIAAHIRFGPTGSNRRTVAQSLA